MTWRDLKWKVEFEEGLGNSLIHLPIFYFEYIKVYGWTLQFESLDFELYLK